MELEVYNGENFERGKTWFLVFTLIVLVFVIFSILSSNITGGIFLLLIFGCYIFYITKSNNTIKMIIGKNALQIGRIALPRNDLSGFVLEYHTKKEKIHNIVIIDKNKRSEIYTIRDTEKNLENFVNELNEYIPMLDNYGQTTMDKFIRKLKL